MNVSLKGLQALVKARQGVGRMVFEGADVHPGLHHGAIRPDARATQVTGAQDADVGKVHDGRSRVDVLA